MSESDLITHCRGIQIYLEVAIGTDTVRPIPPHSIRMSEKDLDRGPGGDNPAVDRKLGEKLSWIVVVRHRVARA